MVFSTSWVQMARVAAQTDREATDHMGIQAIIPGCHFPPVARKDNFCGCRPSYAS